MIVTNIILACLMAATIGIGSFWAFRSRQSYKLNSHVARELDGIIANTLDVVKKNKELAKQHAVRAISSVEGYPDAFDLESPEILSTIVTVLVSKYGEVKLSQND